MANAKTSQHEIRGEHSGKPARRPHAVRDLIGREQGISLAQPHASSNSACLRMINLSHPTEVSHFSCYNPRQNAVLAALLASLNPPAMRWLLSAGQRKAVPPPARVTNQR